jgi:hypothetical protein
VYAVEAAEIIRATDLAPLVAAQRSRLPVDLEEQFGFYYDITLEALRQTMLYRQGILLGIASYLS